MRKITVLYGVAAVISIFVAGQAVSDEIPKQVIDRTFYPKTDEYKPEALLGYFFYKDFIKSKLQFLGPPLIGASIAPIINFHQSAIVYKHEFQKGDEAKFSIPGLASATLADQEVQSLTIVDVAEANLADRAFKDFCEAWPIVRNYRDWKPGDELHYIYHTLLSQVSSKIGKKHQKGAEFGLGDYFSAGGTQYDQEGEIAIVPAIAYDDVYYTISDAIIKHGCTAERPKRKHNLNINEQIGSIRTVEFISGTKDGLIFEDRAPK